MANRNDVYHEIEGRQAGQALLKKESRLIFNLLYSVVAIMILYLFKSGTTVFSISMFFMPIGKASFQSTDFHYLRYFLVTLPLVIIVYGMIYPMSYAQKQKQMEIKASKGIKQGKISLLYLEFWRLVDIGFYYLMMPVSMLLLVGVAERDRQRIFIRWGWLSHLEKNFFKQEFRQVDGYDRVEKLNIMADFAEYFSKEKGQKALVSNEYAFIRWLFKSRAEMIDLMRIAEGFIEAKTPIRKYDKFLSKEEYEERLKKAGSLDNFRTYNGTDEVIYSHHLIKDIIDDEAKKFEEYIVKYAFDSRMLFARRFRKYEAGLKNDVNLRRYIFPKTKSKEQIELILGDVNRKRAYLVFVMVCYFRFVLWKMIVSQYVNLPAGTIVVKLRDYTIRMIVEVFDDNSLINIVQNKNDGSTDSFESDNLTNMFLSALHHYRTSTAMPYDVRLEKIFNHNGDDVLSEDLEHTTDAISSDISSFFKSGWVQDAAESMV